MYPPIIFCDFFAFIVDKIRVFVHPSACACIFNVLFTKKQILFSCMYIQQCFSTNSECIKSFYTLISTSFDDWILMQIFCKFLQLCQYIVCTSLSNFCKFKNPKYSKKLIIIADWRPRDGFYVSHNLWEKLLEQLFTLQLWIIFLPKLTMFCEN
jgi:hypothetical protein